MKVNPLSKVYAQMRLLERAMKDLSATPCAVCGHQYSVHVPGLRCYGLRCKCTEFCDPELRGS